MVNNYVLFVKCIRIKTLNGDKDVKYFVTKFIQARYTLLDC